MPTENLQRIGIIHIATGPYKQFTERFVSSTVGGFENKRPKVIYIITDDPEMFAGLGERYHCEIRLKRIAHEPWPAPTLKRFHYINSLSEQFKDDRLSHLFFVNANAVFVSAEPVDELESVRKKIGFVVHPAFVKKPKKAPFESRPSSSAYVPNGDSKEVYVQGFFYGGELETFLELSRVLETRIEADLTKDMVAIWHDESHLNWAHATRWKSVSHIFDAGHAFPEGWRMTAPCRILSRDKSKVMDISFKRNSPPTGTRKKEWGRSLLNYFRF